MDNRRRSRRIHCNLYIAKYYQVSQNRFLYKWCLSGILGNKIKLILENWKNYIKKIAIFVPHSVKGRGWREGGGGGGEGKIRFFFFRNLKQKQKNYSMVVRFLVTVHSSLAEISICSSSPCFSTLPCERHNDNDKTKRARVQTERLIKFW